jgi:hypothetical protein
MSYLDTFNILKNKINYEDDIINLEKIDIHNFSFNSNAYNELPGNDCHFCSIHGTQFKTKDSFNIKIGEIGESLNLPDSNIETNKFFRYHIFKPRQKEKAKDIILLFHGFNEKHWEKYLPWAQKMAEDTNKTIVLFPIAFHMNRAPKDWVDKRLMFGFSDFRKNEFQDVVSSALSNVAISMRLHSMPQRFLWSGLQTYYDVIQFIEECKSGKHPLIEKDCTFDIFCYSIGCFLAEIIKFTDFKGYFTNSKICMFCGGTVFNRLSPVSKFILDSEANIALYSYLVEHISSHLKRDDRLRHFLSEAHPEGLNFYSMLNYNVMREYRESLFRKIQDQVLAITLQKDTVIPSYEIINTLQGIARDIKIPVEIYDFPYDYIHEDPFPAKKSIEKEVDESFIMIFDRVCKFFNG